MCNLLTALALLMKYVEYIILKTKSNYSNEIWNGHVISLLICRANYN